MEQNNNSHNEPQQVLSIIFMRFQSIN